MFQSDDTECCHPECWRLITNGEFDRHLNDVQYFRGLGYKAFWSWVRTNYYNSVPFVRKRGKTVLGESSSISTACYRTSFVPQYILYDTWHPEGHAFFPQNAQTFCRRACCCSWRPPPQALTPEEVDEVVNFLLQQSRQVAIVGHTKFPPDQLFGLIHALLKKHDFIVPADLPPKVQEYGRQKRQPGEKKWTVNATLVEEDDEVFRKFKSLATPYNPIKGIKKMAIESILFEEHYVEGVRTVKVSYKLVEKDGYNEVATLKRGQTWPERGVLDDDNLPDVIPWKKLSNTRYLSLLKSMDKISGQVTDDHRQFNESLPAWISRSASAHYPGRCGYIDDLCTEQCCCTQSLCFASLLLLFL